MWFAGLVIGGLLGAAIGDALNWAGAWLLFAVAGAIAGLVLREKVFVRPASAPTELFERIAALEKDLAKLKAAHIGSSPGAKGIRELPQAVADSAPTNASVHRSALESSASAGLLRKLLGGNILAKIGVTLLFFGVASALKLGIEFGLFPPAVRLLAAAVLGIVMIGFGFFRMRVQPHRMFALSVQGGGFAILYLTAYFAFAWYEYIGHATAFVLFAALGIACVALAVRFDGEALAVLGVSGAFLAALLASTGKGSHVVLFSYYAVLNILVLAVYWPKRWRTLMLGAFVFTLVIGMSWAANHFEREFFASTEMFVVLFSLLFSAIPVVSAAKKGEKLANWVNGGLAFGTPIAAAAAQSWLVKRSGLGDVTLAWSAAGAALYYLGLWRCLVSTDAEPPIRLAHIAIAVAFLTISVPLAFGAQATSAFWAVEGFAIVWLALANRSRLALGGGIALQMIAGFCLLDALPQIERLIPLANGGYVGGAIIAACGAASAWTLYCRDAVQWPPRDVSRALAGVVFTWALAWWLGIHLFETDKFAPVVHETAIVIAAVVATAWMLEAAGIQLRAAGPRYVALSLVAVAIAAGFLDTAAWEGGRYTHVLHHGMCVAIPAALLSFCVQLRRLESDGLEAMASAGHLFYLWIIAVLATLELVWLTRELAPGDSLWPLLATGIVSVATAMAVLFLVGRRTSSLSRRRELHLRIGVPALLAFALAWAVYANLEHSGAGSGLPYLPLASFFDAAQLLVMFAVAYWARAAAGTIVHVVNVARGALAILGFVWLSAMAMRIAHHWGGVAFEASALIGSPIAQSILSVTWTVIALALMINATWAALREQWFTGFSLLAVVGLKLILVDLVNKGTITWSLSLISVGALILAASYFSPAPPKAQAQLTT